MALSRRLNALTPALPQLRYSSVGSRRTIGLG